MTTRRNLFALTAVTILILAFQQKKPYDLKASIARGEQIYTSYCLSCHMDQGQGIDGVYPPLAKSDYLMADKKRSIQQVLYGVSGEIKVNGKTYNLEMTGFDLTDEEAADVLNYIRNSWGNKGAAVTPEEVRAARK
ncbi:MAG: cytochrome c [Cyclobacteriaceae bacterium]|nr:cytochrome c [Cyclobacteriaceae bacterium]MDW8331235.1 cytochrome c [Cyclobacteriaceae bacterium]